MLLSSLAAAAWCVFGCVFSLFGTVSTADVGICRKLVAYKIRQHRSEQFSKGFDLKKKGCVGVAKPAHAAIAIVIVRCNNHGGKIT